MRVDGQQILLRESQRRTTHGPTSGQARVRGCHPTAAADAQDLRRDEHGDGGARGVCRGAACAALCRRDVHIRLRRAGRRGGVREGDRGASQPRVTFWHELESYRTRVCKPQAGPWQVQVRGASTAGVKGSALGAYCVPLKPEN
eukprot:scaffold2182_cov118-Isochrysis_galbana.AAC.17